jgi:hypothetical protein
MNNLHLLPIASAGLDEEAQQAGQFGAIQPVRFLPQALNFATNEKVRTYVRNELVPLLNETRQERLLLEEEWKAIRNMNLLKHDGGQSYHGRAKNYLPVFRKAKTTHISALSRGLFPSDEYMDVASTDPANGEAGKTIKTYLQWEFETVAKLRTRIKPFLGQYVDYGNTVFKGIWSTQLKSKAAPNFMPMPTGGTDVQYGFKSQMERSGLLVSPRSMFYVYVYPTTAESLDDASLVFEDIDLPRSYFEMMKLMKRWENVDGLLEGFVNEDHDARMQEMLNARDAGGQPGRTFGINKAGTIGTVTESWTFMHLPRQAYLPGEDHRLPLPVYIVTCGEHVLAVTRNPYFSQQHPYLFSRMDVEPGYFYGTGHGRTMRYLQYLANDFANQTCDVGTYGLNPIAKMNPGLMVGPPRPLRPGGTIFMSDVKNGLEFDRPPIEGVGFGMQMLQSIIGMAQDFGGTPQVMQGTGAGKAAKTATGAQILQRNASMPIQDSVEDIELDVLVPLMRMTHSYAQQFRDKNVMVTVAGQSIEVTREVLATDAQYRWMASSQSSNNQIRAQQAITLIQAIVPLLPVLMQQGYVVDFVALIRRVFTDGFGFRGFDDFIKRAQAAPGVPPPGEAQPGQQVAPDQMAGVQAEQGDRLRSALEQVYGMEGAGDAQPGEAEDFAQVRQGADQMAAQMGGMQGGGMEQEG